MSRHPRSISFFPKISKFRVIRLCWKMGKTKTDIFLFSLNSLDHIRLIIGLAPTHS